MPPTNIPQKRLMIRSVIIMFISVLFLKQCTSSKESNPPLPPNKFFDDQNCYYNGKLTKIERRQIYPFNSAEKIKIISFNAQLCKTPIVNDTIVESNAIELITLTTNQIDSLTDILYNYNYSKKTNVIVNSVAGCYYPRHAIIFMDKSNKVLTYMELCLECHQVVSDLPHESTGLFCQGKYELLKNYFKAIGIKYYTD